MTALLALWATGTAAAGFPQSIQPSSMVEHEGEVVLDSDLLGSSWTQLVKELGTIVANKPIAPARTLGFAGWEIGAWNQFAFIGARNRNDTVSPWDRAWANEKPPEFLSVPTLGVRKGLPFSTEVGFNVGWIANTQTGTASGFGRVAILEGYRPSPDISIQLGYAGYVGNDEIELSVLDLGVTLGTTAYAGKIPGINTARISPWITLSSLRISAVPRLDVSTFEEIGATEYRGGSVPEDGNPTKTPLILPMVGAGLQIISRGVHLRLVASWAPATIPTASVGMGFTF